ncbi:LytTR family DNA-binding domain-containing protein [Asticcacaulis sp. 201]|uniref:LytR/AlgR family response regulator transcription factor n=1 Tax=Asticcacaulis sp. 201 TaxID=3028787 RepID=UPI00291624A0|nr:LytTR family DNA-binding domain-containing protein [Asticcacaulis sp. 201]MDV6330670.1 LytTR family DNA-binding domain-containing protein [Asticcacaulis sp. 201]
MASRLSGGWLADTHGLRLTPLLIMVGAVTSVVVATNITSEWIDGLLRTGDVSLWPAMNGGSSAAAILVLCPLIFRFYRRLSQRALPRSRLVILHVLAACVFCMLHVGIMVALRKLIYSVGGTPYDFSTGNLSLQLIYEARKDALTYAVIVGMIWISDCLIATRRKDTPSDPTGHISIKIDNRVHYVAQNQILWISAAGNYIELFVSGRERPWLVRDSLGAFQSRLPASTFTRIHRSHMINRLFLSDVALAPSGDFTVTLKTGHQIRGSRRFRKNLDV